MENERDSGDSNWSEAVEDLVTAGDTDGAISLLELVISRLEALGSSESVDLQLASALSNLASLNASKGFSLKADQIHSRALTAKHRASCIQSSSGLEIINEVAQEGRVSELDNGSLKGQHEESTRLSDDAVPCNESSEYGQHEESTRLSDDAVPCNESSEYDWEAIADCAPNDLLPTQCLPAISELSLKDTKVQTPKRRGRGTFSYKKQELYSDQQYDNFVADNLEDEEMSHNTAEHTKKSQPRYGTRHVVVLADFLPSTRTTELEKLFEGFKDRGFAIRWVSDTVALAVFRSPSIALEAQNFIQCPFTVRILDEDDAILSSIPAQDLEPPRERPQTTARTAQRLIAHGMGLKLPSTSGSREFKQQEEARRNRIVTRQKLRDDAWGD